MVSSGEITSYSAGRHWIYTPLEYDFWFSTKRHISFIDTNYHVVQFFKRNFSEISGNFSQVVDRNLVKTHHLQGVAFFYPNDKISFSTNHLRFIVRGYPDIFVDISISQLTYTGRLIVSQGSAIILKFYFYRRKHSKTHVFLNKLFFTYYYHIFLNWDSFHTRLNSHYEVWYYKKKNYKKIKA